MRKSILMVAAAGALLAAAAAVHAAPAGVDALIKQGHFWQEKGRSDLAIEAYRRVLAIDPQNPEAKAALDQVQSSRFAKPTPTPSARQAAGAADKPGPVVAGRADEGPAAKRSAHARSAPKDLAGPKRAAGFLALNAGNLAVAEQDFKAALAQRANDPDSQGGLGVVYLRQGRFSDAEPLLTSAARVSAEKWGKALETAQFYTELRAAQSARDSGDYGVAETKARALVARGDDEARSATRLLADVLSAQGRSEDAAGVYATLAHTLTGADAAAAQVSALRARAQADAAAGRTDAAMQTLYGAISGGSTEPWILHDYAEMLLGQDRTEDALQVIKPLEEKSDPQSIYAAALILREAGRAEEAGALIDRLTPEQMGPELRRYAISVKVSQAVARAKVLRETGRRAEAIRELDALATRPLDDPSSIGDIALAYAELGRTDQSNAMLASAAHLTSGDPMANANVVLALVRGGQQKQAADLIARLAARSGHTPAISRLRAMAAAAEADRLRLSGRLAESFDLLQAAWAAAPRDRDLLGATARLYEAGKMSTQAAQVYEMILQQRPKNTDALLGLARSASGAGKREIARQALRNAAEVGAKDPAVLIAAAETSRDIGDVRQAKGYLQQAKALLEAENALPSNGAFPATNPFLSRASLASNDAGVALSSLNPFRLAADADRLQPLSSEADGPADPFLPQRQTSTETLKRDSELSQIDGQIDALAGESAPSVEGKVNVRTREGESGLSQLNEVQAQLRAQGTVGGVVLGVSATPTVLEAGALSSSALARFGYNATPEAVGIVAREPSILLPAKSARDSGLGLQGDLQAGGLSLAVGATPVGFERVNATAQIGWRQPLSTDTSLTLSVSRQAVQDSVTSYAGSKDPVTGRAWGGVLSNQASANLAFDHDGLGLYIQGIGRTFDGTNVRSNSAYEFNAGGYMRAFQGVGTTLTVGANVNFQGYDNDQDYFTFGHGGYFSPQQFAAFSLPINLTTRIGRLDLAMALAPGYQTFNEAPAPVYPTDLASQDVLNALKAQDTDVRSQYDSQGKNGFALNGSLNASYPIRPGAKLSLGVSYNSFGPFNEVLAEFGVRQTLGGH